MSPASSRRVPRNQLSGMELISGGNLLWMPDGDGRRGLATTELPSVRDSTPAPPPGRGRLRLVLERVHVRAPMLASPISPASITNANLCRARDGDGGAAATTKTTPARWPPS